jgi:predicted GH43/DUF377 family glycosyl hydrolase
MLTRFDGNPILEPISDHKWETRCVFNAAAFHKNGVHIIYRAMGADEISSFGYAFSRDGFHIDQRLDVPIYELEHEWESRGVEDPRTVSLDDRVYMTYAGYDGKDARVFMASIDEDDLVANRWNWKRHGCILPVLPVPDKDDKNAALFCEKVGGRYMLIHRIPPDIWVSYSDDMVNWYDHKILARPREGMWDEAKVGAGGPPLKTDLGWLFIYHGVEWRKGGGFGTYRLGLMLLDRDNPEKILFRSDEPILEPAREYERQGHVSDVVFSCGNVVIRDELLVYYGGADTLICVATARMSDILATVGSRI